MNELSIVIPYLSYDKEWPTFVDTLAGYVRENPSDIDIIIVGNPDVDNLEEIARYCTIHYPWIKLTLLQRNGKNVSFGALVRFGVAHSTSRYAVIVSPHGEDDLNIITVMLNKIRQGAQVVQATRYSRPEDSKYVPFMFKMYQAIYRTLIRIFSLVSLWLDLAFWACS